MDTPAVTVLVLVGSLHQGSANGKLAQLAISHAPAGMTLHQYAGLAQLPFYNEDIERNLPANVGALREAAEAADAILFVSPEHNGTIPAVLKNAIDWLSRPVYGSGALTGKPVAVIGAALGGGGGINAHNDTRRSVTVALAHVVADSTLAIPASAAAFNNPAHLDRLLPQLTDVLTRVQDTINQRAPK
ncbi:NAD(P)H-dependent oxidoreductase [Plantibacter sp. RU18]|uniref:NAD(P)H-dependent oxidoreductase n=1 Tax=Plantibacter sp. RU18 TaxID=3158143 RepID=UPI003D362A14